MKRDINDTPTISVVIPVYNRATFIGRCIESIINQGIESLEIIAVDDGSTDCSLSVMQDLASKYTNLKVIKKGNGGVSSARNVGIKAAKGDYIMFVDSDDYLLPDSLKIGLKRAFELGSNPDIIYFGLKRIGISGRTDMSVAKSRYYSKDEIPEIYKNHDQLFFGSPCFKLYNSNIITRFNIDFDTSMKQYEDIVFNLCFVKHCRNAVIVDVPIYCYDCHTNADSKVPSLFGGERWFSDLKKYYETSEQFMQDAVNQQDANRGGAFAI